MALTFTPPATAKTSECGAARDPAPDRWLAAARRTWASLRFPQPQPDRQASPPTLEGFFKLTN